MKTRLYHKVIKMAIKEICSDPRPSVQDIFFKIYCKKDLIGNFTKISMTEKRNRDAMFAYIAWHEKVNNNLPRYHLKAYIKEKYKQYARRYWSSTEVLKRDIEFGIK